MTYTTGATTPGTPTDKNGDDEKHGEVKTTHIVPDPRFVTAMAISLAWQLALVVIVPIVGGYALDQHYHKSPLLTLAGLVIALIGVFGVLSKVAIDASHSEGNGTTGKAV